MKIRNLLLVPLFSLLLSSCSISFGPDSPIDPVDPDPTPTPTPTPTPDPDPDPEVNYFPTERVASFFEKYAVSMKIPTPEVKYKEHIRDIEERPYIDGCLEIILATDYSTRYIDLLKKNGYTYYDLNARRAYTDANHLVAIECSYSSYYSYTTICYYRYMSYFADYPEVHNYGIETIDYLDTVNTSQALQDLPANLSGKDVTVNGIKYAFDRSTGSLNPGHSGGLVTLKMHNKLTISTTVTTIHKIVFKVEEPSSGEYGSLTSSDSYVLKYNDDYSRYTWIGETNNITFTCDDLFLFSGIEITYLKDVEVDAPTEGVSDINYINETYSDMEYTPDENGYYKSNVKVKLHVRVMKKFNSKSITKSARMKYIATDPTGVILLSSFHYNEDDPFYYIYPSRYLEVEGYVSFEMGKLEINIESYKYYSTMKINFDSSNIFKKEIDTQQELLDDLFPLEMNENGYARGNFVKFKTISEFQYLNYIDQDLFIDKNGDIIPLEGNVTTYKGYVSDVYALEVMIDGRPELMVFHNDEYEFEYPTNKFNRDNIIALTSLDEIKVDLEGFDYRTSLLKVYTLDGYFSLFNPQKYTFNTKYYSYNENAIHYTTGKHIQDFIDFGSVFSYNHNGQTINNLKSDEEVEANKVTFNFLLTKLDCFNDQYFWRICEVDNLDRK